MEGGCGNFMKYVLGFVNLIIFIGGAVLLGIGINALVGDKHQINNLISNNLYTGTAILLIIAGGLIALISFLGCCGAFQESKCLLGTYFCFVFVLFVLTVAGGVTAFVYGGDATDAIKKALQDSMDDYGKKEETTDAWDYLQKNFQCCGVDGKKSWTDKGLPIPGSCGTFNTGCFSQVEDFINDNSSLFGWLAIGVVIFLLVSMVFTCAIMKSI